MIPGGDNLKTVAIIGAGPAGLSAAYELLSNSNEYKVVIFEKEGSVGGLSKTYEFPGGKIDIGGHRFFTKNDEVLGLWKKVLSFDEDGMLVRNRKSHILWNSRLINYPITLDIQMLKIFDVITCVEIFFSYLHAKIKRKKVTSLEDFYIKRFGKKLYVLFFEEYTKKLWGIYANQLSADWGEQRIQKISLGQLLKSIIIRKKNVSSEERSITDKYMYPAFGAGQLWSKLAAQIREMGGVIKLNCKVTHLSINDSLIKSISYQSGDIIYKDSFDYVITSMPLRELCCSLDKLPTEVLDIAKRLYYRDMLVIGLEIKKDKMGIIYNKAEKDSWLYTQDSNMSFGRIQILNNWSPYVVKNKENVLLELELFCDKGDELWEMKDAHLVRKVMHELQLCRFCKSGSKVESSIVKRIEQAYPVYTEGYYQLEQIRNYLDVVKNLQCIGRNGQHKYNNMDHSVESGIQAANNIINGNIDRKKLWNINVKKEYYEK